MKTIKGDLVLKENFSIDDDLTVEGNIRCEGGSWNINARDIKAVNIDAGNISFYAFAIAYHSFKCKSWKGRRDNHIAKCLDGEIEIDKPKTCDKCGSELK